MVAQMVRSIQHYSSVHYDPAELMVAAGAVDGVGIGITDIANSQQLSIFAPGPFPITGFNGPWHNA
jgi:hypothetical protein